ncbi:hypothetical protein LA080_009284 [Diaporthe eres]|nr:hypothetical protein LA080_009284 [Diaporthe eres]
MKDGGGLVLPDIISSDSELWRDAKAAIMQRLRFRNAGYVAWAGMQCVLEPQLEAWVGEGVMKRCRYCTNNIFKAADPLGAPHKFDAHQITARMGLTLHDGGFDPAVPRRIEESLNHMIKHMLWAFDFVRMEKDNYKGFVPADRYRLARMLGLMPNGKVPLVFDIVSKYGPNKGQKVGVWRGTLDQLSHEKGDQRLLPNKT